ncbi:MAG: peptidoglycan bridge formation glycyltransferase FemA/FemB family protein [bacterium]|nr:peptidoglycan bridge formation glycyltransferase FemA/FemB family protein [bacterium]
MNAAPPPLSQVQWDAFVRANPHGHVLQGWGWGSLKSAYGWAYERVGVWEGETLVGAAQVLFRRLPFRLGTMAYLPMRPLIAPQAYPDSTDPGDGEWYDDIGRKLWRAVDQAARAHGAAFLKWEPGLTTDDMTQPDSLRMGRNGYMERFHFHPSPQTIQPPNTVVIEIAGDEEAILARMNQGTRRKIRQSQKHGIRYFQAARVDVARFTALMQVTGSRNAFGVHEAGYYEKAYDLFVPQDAALILAEHEGDVLAGVFVFAVGAWAWYLYGASASDKRNLMASYGAQWAAIQWAKARGCAYYDMWGIPDADPDTLEANFETRSDGLWGVYGFKRGWGGQVIRAAGAWDRVYNPVIYSAYKTALRIRSRGHDDA